MDVLVVDTAARGHAEAWKIANSPECDRLWLTEAGALAQEIADVPTGKDGEPISASDPAGLSRFARQNKIDLAVVSADRSLEAEVVDALEEEGINVFGPTRTAAEIEISKVYSKQLMRRLGIPTADFKAYESFDEAITYGEGRDFPLFVKPDHLAEGKGAKKTKDIWELRAHLRYLEDIDRLSADEQIVIEKALLGPELSLHAWSDGKDSLMFPFAMMDHKTLYDDDEGPMTGGMGVVGPVPNVSPIDIDRLGESFIAPIIHNAAKEGRQFKGVLYPGLRIPINGPHVLEYNARPGDPETQVWAPLLQSDLLEIALACAEGRLGTLEEIRWRQTGAACLTLAAEGYPRQPKKGAVIEGLDDVTNLEGIEVFDYGIKENNGNFIVNTGRVLSIVAIGQNGETTKDILSRAYEASDMIRFDGKLPILRRDIGRCALSSEFRQRISTTKHLF